MDKIINSRCSCKKSLIFPKSNLLMLEPCEHLVHKKCLKLNENCMICNEPIKAKKTLLDLKKEKEKNKQSYQKYVDMISMTNYDELSKVNKDLLMPNMIDFVGILSTIPMMNGYDDAQKGCHELFCLMNAKIIVNGMDNINLNKPKVYIANHTTYLDFVVIFYLLKCGFLSSSYIKETWIGRLILDIIPLMVIDRNESTNTVDKMKKYVKKYGSICLFPEGMFSHPDTIIKFRTGAFHIGYPIYPVVIKYDPVIIDTSVNTNIQKLVSSDNITITVNILPECQPPFDIEDIRNKMAKVGNFALSRVSNRDVTEK
jgi:1-acyl-sn-glycerol-3-phosphate acyltransferase